MKNELETLMTAVAAAADTCTVTARSMAAIERAWAAEHELWLVCFFMPPRSQITDPSQTQM